MGRRKRKRKAPVRKETCNRPKKYKKWSEESITGAMKAVADGLLGVIVTNEYGVSRTTLKDRLSGKVVHEVWAISIPIWR